MKNIYPSFKAVVATAILITAMTAVPRAWSQGCVAARGAGMSCATGLHLGDTLPPLSGFQASVGYRWLHSDRHFVGDVEQTQRERDGSQVINDSHFVDLSATYAFNPRWSATLTLPLVTHDRSQTVRSNDTRRTIVRRFSTQATGIGDVRAEVNAWLLDPVEHMKGNVLLGLGFDAPTGEKDATDTFQVFRSGRILAEERTVDQSIQPGDGGWGIILDVYAYRQLMPRVNGYLNGAYTITPEGKSGVPTFRSSPYEAEMSIGDSYMGRGGFEFLVCRKIGLTLSLGGRIEGVPVEDLVGSSDGFRRPGYAVSIEPGLSLTYKTWFFNLYTPVAVYRNREQSVPDQQETAATGVFRHGDSAFADYLVMCSVTKRF
jgi:hypothetical protein